MLGCVEMIYCLYNNVFVSGYHLEPPIYMFCHMMIYTTCINHTFLAWDIGVSPLMASLVAKLHLSSKDDLFEVEGTAL